MSLNVQLAAFVVASLALPAMILFDVLRHPEPPTAPIMVLTYDTDGRIISVPATTYYQQERTCVEHAATPSSSAPATPSSR